MLPSDLPRGGGSDEAPQAAPQRTRLAAAELEIAVLRAAGVAADAASTRAAAELEACRAALRTAEEVRIALESAVEYAVFTTDLARRVALWSDGARRLFGYEAAEILGQLADLLFLPEDRAAGVPEEELRAVVSRGRAPSERWLLRRDGSRFWARGVALPRWGGGATVKGLVKVVRDATESWLAEAAVREGEARFRSLFDAAPVMMWVTDATGCCTQVNRRWCEFTGLSEARAFGSGWLDEVHPDDRDWMEAGCQSANARRESYNAEYRMRRADGAWRWVLKTAEPRYAESGTYCGFVGSILDITGRREAEERQALLVRELDHRAKNALAVVQAAVKLTPANDAHRFAEAVRGRVDALARAHTLLAARHWASADLHQLVAAELASFLHAGAAGVPRAELDGPPVALAPHAAQALSMVVHELATNATKHGALSAPDGHVAVSWRVDSTEGALRLRWVETGGPAVAGEPSRRGFGSRLIETTIRMQLGGTLSRAWTPTGLFLEIAVPLARMVAGPGAHDTA